MLNERFLQRAEVLRIARHLWPSAAFGGAAIEEGRERDGIFVTEEMVHLIEATHSERFIGILEKHYPTWREARAELNELPLTTEIWNE